jgi:hypothetical protein
MRFSLKALLIVATLLTLFFGYAAWRRQVMMRRCEQLRLAGYAIALPDDWKNKFWPVVPQQLSLACELLPPRGVIVNGRAFADEETTELYCEVYNQVRRLGVREVELQDEPKQWLGRKRTLTRFLLTVVDVVPAPKPQRLPPSSGMPSGVANIPSGVLKQRAPQAATEPSVFSCRSFLFTSTCYLSFSSSLRPSCGSPLWRRSSRS